MKTMDRWIERLGGGLGAARSGNWLATLCAAIAVSVGTATAEAAVTQTLFNVTFEGDTVGAPPTLNAAPIAGVLPITQPQSMLVQSGASILVKDQSSYPALGSKAVELVDSSSGANSGFNLEFKLNAADIVTNDLLLIRFDLLLANVPGSIGNVSMVLRNSASGGIGGFQMNGNSGALQMLQYDNGTGAFLAAPFIGTNTVGVLHRYEVALNYATGMQSHYLDGTLLGTGEFGANTEFRGATFSSTDPAILTLVVDNFSVIPEPSATALVGLATLAGWIAKRRRKISS